MSLPRVGIIGTGFFGTALKNALLPLVGKKISRLEVWERIEERPKTDPAILILAIPSTAKNGDKLAILDYIEKFPRAQIVVTSKGRKVLKIFQKHVSLTDRFRVFSLSGPNLADQITFTPTATKLAGFNNNAAVHLAEIITGELLNVEPSDSLEVVQRGGMLKNFLVFELGKVWEALATPELQMEATMLALQTGYSSIHRQVSADENRAEFLDISGLGDILLCLGIFCEFHGSRNFRAGKMIASGSDHDAILKEFRTLEGLQVSIKFHSELPPEFLRCDRMNQFRDFILSPESLVAEKFTDEQFASISHELWERFQVVAKKKEFQSNTHAWVICEIFQELAQDFSISLANFESAEPLLRAVLRAVFSPAKITSTTQGEQVWKRLVKKLPFLK